MLSTLQSFQLPAMAVLLRREGDRRNQPVSPEMRRLPRVTVRNKPISAAPHWSGRLTARTANHMAYENPSRKEVWRETFER